MIRVILADDHRIVREGVRRVLDVQPGIQILGEASRGEEALDILEKVACDVLVMDLAMSGLHGREFVEKIRSAFPKLGIVIFSMYPEDPFALYFLRCGVNAFVTKEREPGDLVEAIRLAAQGKCFIPERLDSNPPARGPDAAPMGVSAIQESHPMFGFSSMAPSVDASGQSDKRPVSDKPRLTLGPVTVDMESGQVQHPAGNGLLSTHELALLAYLVPRSGQTISRDELLREVWGYSSRAQTRTVEMTVSRLRRKVEINATNPRFILTIHGDGYRLDLERAGT
jgi:DNA-binding response OmpR family regulator